MWSEALQKQTREYFKSMPFAAMKQIGGKFGICVFRENTYHIVDRETNAEYLYETMDALIEAKWAID